MDWARASLQLFVDSGDFWNVPDGFSYLGVPPLQTAWDYTDTMGDLPPELLYTTLLSNTEEVEDMADTVSAQLGFNGPFEMVAHIRKVMDEAHGGEAPADIASQYSKMLGTLSAMQKDEELFCVTVSKLLNCTAGEVMDKVRVDGAEAPAGAAATGQDDKEEPAAEAAPAKPKPRLSVGGPKKAAAKPKDKPAPEPTEAPKDAPEPKAAAKPKDKPVAKAAAAAAVVDLTPILEKLEMLDVLKEHMDEIVGKIPKTMEVVAGSLKDLDEGLDAARGESIGATAQLATQLEALNTTLGELQALVKTEIGSIHQAFGGFTELVMGHLAGGE